MQKEVLIIFKTHLDIGFTDYSKNIIKRYMDEYIPNAIKEGNVLKDTTHHLYGRLVHGLYGRR